jgi:hypothetical protein
LKFLLSVFFLCAFASASPSKEAAPDLQPLVDRMMKELDTVADETPVSFEADTEQLESELKKLIAPTTKKEMTWGEIKKTAAEWEKFSPETKVQLVVMLRRLSSAKFKGQSAAKILEDLIREQAKDNSVMIAVPKRLVDEWSKKNDEEALKWKLGQASVEDFLKKVEEEGAAKPTVAELSEILGGLVKDTQASSSLATFQPGLLTAPNEFLSQLPKVTRRLSPSTPMPVSPSEELAIQERIRNLPNLASIPERNAIPETSYDYGHHGMIGGQRMPSGQMNFKGGVSLPKPVRPVTSDEIEALKEGYPGAKVSVEMTTRFENDPQGGASCQASPVMSRPLGAGMCHFAFATAQHCVVSASGGVSHIELPGLGWMLNSPKEVVRDFTKTDDVGVVSSYIGAGMSVVELNPNRLDVALVHTTHRCNDNIPIFPPRPGSFVGDEPLFIDTDRVHVAMPNGAGTKGSVGVQVLDGIIVPGNSGGGVVDANRNWVGAVSTVYVGYPHHGFIASDYALEWVRRGLKNFLPEQPVPHANPKDLAFTPPTHWSL